MLRRNVTLLLLALFLLIAPSARADVEAVPLRVYWAHTAAVTNVASLSGLSSTIGGVAIDTNGMRVALTNQTTASEDGIWIARAGAWERSFPSVGGNALVLIMRGVNKGMCASPNWDGSASPSTWLCN